MTSPTEAPHRVWPNPNNCTADCGNFDELTALRLQRHRLLARLTKPAAPAGLDVERLARALVDAENDDQMGTEYHPKRLAEYILAAAYAEGEPTE